LRRRSTGTREKEKGKLRFVGITEAAPFDLEHKMYQRALAEDDVWDIAIVAFNMMHRNARVSVFPKTRGKKVGTLIMFAVRGIFARPERLNAKARSPVADGQLPKWLGDSPDPLGFLVHKGSASSIIDEPIASCATSPVWTWCCSAPATPIICARTSPRCPSRPCPRRTASGL
jgi:hypothetical protein